ncbi:MAG: transcriptional repressor [Clostridia bacterium]
MRYSKQRECIYRTVMKSDSHPTANMVYSALKTEYPKLSLGTVYRNLNQLTDVGRLKRIPLPDGGCRFDGTTFTHSHIICETCGHVADVMVPPLIDLEQAIQRETDYTLSSFDLVLYGQCALCHQSGNTLS